MPTFLESALHFFHAGQWDAARKAARLALASDPAQAAALNLKAVCLFQSGRAAEAVPLFRRAVRTQPDFAEAMGNLGVALQAGGGTEAAERCARLQIALTPQASAALGRLAVFRHDDGDLDGGIRLFGRAVRIAPTSLADRLNLAQLLHAAGRSSAAAAVLRASLGLEPRDAGVCLHLGKVLLSCGALADALRFFARALVLDPDVSDAAACQERGRRLLAAARAAIDPGERPGLVVRAPLTSVSGYGHMACRFLDHLRKRDVPLYTIGVFGGEQWPGTERPVRSRVALHCMVPSAVEPVPGTRTVVFSMFEGPRIPPAWKRFSDRHDLVVVPCEASRRAWMAQGYPEDRLRICPLGVDTVAPGGGRLEFPDRRGRPVSSYRRRILNISDFVARKNIDGLLRVWLKSTARDDDAVLILKLGKGAAAQRQAIEALIRRTEEAVGKRFDDAAAIAILDQRLSDAEMEGLFRASTHYWSLSHGEGWDLPLTKAGAHGLGLIAPRHSAYEDYLDDTVARMIPATVGRAFEPYGQRPYPPFFDLDWWLPDEDAAAAIIADLVGGRAGTFPDARPRLLGRFSWERAIDRLRVCLDEAATP